MFKDKANRRLHIYMKSGNTVVTAWCEDYEVKWRGDDIVGLKLSGSVRTKGKPELVLGSVNLSQIEAISVETR